MVAASVSHDKSELFLFILVLVVFRPHVDLADGQLASVDPLAEAGRRGVLRIGRQAGDRGERLLILAVFPASLFFKNFFTCVP